MALIKCTECGKEISDKANVCINCGCPVTLTEDKYQIILKSDFNKIATVKILMDIKKISLADAKAETDNTPKVLFNNLTLNEANEIVEKLKKVNADILLTTENKENNSTEITPITESKNEENTTQAITTQTNTTPNQNNKGCGIALAIIAGIIILIALFSNDDSSSYDSKYSYDYNNNKEYRDNVNDIADAYGEDAEDVDRMLQAVEGEMNK